MQKAIETSLQKGKVRRIILKTVLTFLIAVIIIATYSFLFYKSEKNAVEEEYIYSSKGLVDNASEKSRMYFNDFFTDLLTLLEQNELFDYLHSNDTLFLKEIEDEVLDFVQLRPLYYNVKYIDSLGNEFLHILLQENRNAVSLPEAQLQNVAEDTYFRQTISLPGNGIYISDFKQHREKEWAANRFLPLIRVAAPLVDTSRNHKGILVISFRANTIIGSIKNTVTNPGHLLYFVNTNGGHIDYASQQNETADSTLHSEVKSFAKKYSKVWNEIGDKRNGVFVTEEGLFVYQKFDRSHLDSSSHERELTTETPVNEYGYYIISHVPDEIFDKKLSGYVFDLSLLNGIILLIIGVGGFLFYRSREEKLIAAKIAAYQNVVFQSLSENVPGVIFRGELQENGDMHYTYISPQCKNIFNINPDEVLENSSLLKIHEEDEEKVRECYKKAARTRTNCKIEGRFVIHKNVIRFRSYARAVKTKNETAFYGILIDITELYEAEQKIMVLSSRLKAIFDAAVHFSIASFSEKGIFTLVNTGFENIFGYNSSEVVNKRSIFDVLQPGFVQKQLQKAGIDQGNNEDFLKRVFDQLQNKGYMEIDAEALRKDGSKRTVQLILSPIKTEANEITDCLCIARDVTEIRRAEEALKESEEKFRMLSTSASDAIIMVSENLEIVYWNRAASDLFGYTEEEAIGLTWDPLIEHEEFHEEFRGQFSDFFKDDIGNIVGSALIFSGVRKDGTSFPLELTFSTFDLKNERHAICIIRDISERREIEMKIKNYVDELTRQKTLIEKQVTELKELNAKLTESEKLLQEMNESKDKFFSIISHDLKSPFMALLGFTDMLISDIESYDKKEILKFITDVHSTARGVYNLLETLLDWSRVQLGKMPFEPAKINLCDIASLSVDLFRGNAKHKHITVNNNIDRDITIFADKNMIDTVIRNLVSNAIKYSKNFGVITLDAQPLERAVMISVEDNGIGMSKEVMDKLFRIDVHHTTPGTFDEKGTGVGLILCKELVEMNGGDIRVESEPGKGSKFIFTLPLENSQNSF